MAMPMICFLVVNTFPKLHTDDLFSWASSPFKIALVFASTIKPIFLWSRNYFLKKYLPKQLLSGNMVILRILQNLRSEKKPVKLFFLLPSNVNHSEISLGLLRRTHFIYFIYMYLVELYLKLLEKPSKQILIIVRVTCVIVKVTSV